MYVANVESTDNTLVTAVLSKWRPAVSVTRTAIAGWENTATLLGREVGPAILDDLHLAIALAGECDYRTAILERLPVLVKGRRNKKRGRSYGRRRAGGSK